MSGGRTARPDGQGDARRALENLLQLLTELAKSKPEAGTDAAALKAEYHM